VFQGSPLPRLVQAKKPGTGPSDLIARELLRAASAAEVRAGGHEWARGGGLTGSPAVGTLGASRHEKPTPSGSHRTSLNPSNARVPSVCVTVGGRLWTTGSGIGTDRITLRGHNHHTVQLPVQLRTAPVAIS
jgi:hypothetical protein